MFNAKELGDACFHGVAFRVERWRRLQKSSRLRSYDICHMTIIMQGEANAKAQKKRASRERILRSAASQLRSMGIDGASVSSIMEEAGLTHGGFYAHFEDKLDLINAAFAYAMDSSREQWLVVVIEYGADLIQCKPIDPFRKALRAGFIDTVGWSVARVLSRQQGIDIGLYQGLHRHVAFAGGWRSCSAPLADAQTPAV